MSRVWFAAVLLTCCATEANACSIFLIADPADGRPLYLGNNEDYWYDVKPFLQVKTCGSGFKRIWWGWNQLWVFHPFAQGGINDKGLFFDGAVVPRQTPPAGHGTARGNLGDDLLASCANVAEALAYLERHRIAYPGAHLFFADRDGNAAVLEWIDGESVVTTTRGQGLIATNFLLKAPERGNHPCRRYSAIEAMVGGDGLDGWSLDRAVDVAFSAIQPEASTASGRKGGTLYTLVVDVREQIMRVYLKGDRTAQVELRLAEEYGKRSHRIPLR